MDNFYKAMFPSGRVDKTMLSLEKIMQDTGTEKKTDKSELPKQDMRKPDTVSRKEKRELERVKEKLKQKEARNSQKREIRKKEMLMNLERVRQQTSSEIRVQSFSPEARERLEKIAFNPLD